METLNNNFTSAASGFFPLSLPRDLYCQIFNCLSVPEITQNIALVCTLWENISQQKALWQSIICQKYPECQKAKKIPWSFQYYRFLHLQRGAVLLRKDNYAVQRLRQKPYYLACQFKFRQTIRIGVTYSK